MKQTKSVLLTGGVGPLRLCALLLLLILAGCNSSNNPAVTPTPTASITFSTIDLGIPTDALNSPIVGPLADDTLMHVRLLFKVNQSQQNQLNKISPQGQDLEKLANQIGISDATFEQIKARLGISGVSLTLSKLHTSVNVDAKAKTIATLFQTHFVIHKYKGRTFYAPTTAPQLPTFIVNDLVSVVGLDSFSQPLQPGIAARGHSLSITHTHTGAQADCRPTGGLLTPTLAHAYGYVPYYNAGFLGQNMTINLVEIDAFPASDVANYGQCVGYRGHITVKNVDSAPTQPGEETALDIEMIQGLAPGANIVDYQTGADFNTGVIDALQQIINDNTQNAGSGSIVSISLGAPENYETLNFLKGTDQLFSVLRQQEHMTVFVASGDCAAFQDHVFGSYSVSTPASDPNVVAVGGTELQTDQNGNRVAEAAWSDGSDPTKCTNSWGSGGGNSNTYPLPDFQVGNGVNNNDSRGFRQLPDVSAAAFDLGIYFGGQWVEVSGTSAATPIWAAGMLLVNNALLHRFHGFYSGPLVFYYVANHVGRQTPYFDVTQGNNLGFNATPGWDFATGFGTPNLVAFYNVLATVASGH